MIQRRQVEIKTRSEIETMREAGHLLRSIFDRLTDRIRPGVTTRQLDRITKRWMDDAGVIPAFLGYQGFAGTLCTSINDEVVHGIPSDRVLIEGDILSVDMGLILDGFYSDSARTYPVGEIDAESKRLIQVTEESLEVGIRQLQAGNRVGDYSAAVQKYVEARGFSLVREYAGHGVGRSLHESPQIPNHGHAGRGQRFLPGMVVAVEPMVNAGTHKTRVLDDKWTVVTTDGKRSAHAEHTVAITENGPEILTI